VKTSVEPLDGNKVKLTVEVEESEFERAVDAAFRKIAREVRIPGFRPGKAPRRLLEARLGPGVARQEALRDALPEYYAKAVKDEDIDVIAPPEIDITAGEDDGPVQFDAVVEVRPQVQVPGYGGLRVTLDSPKVTDEEVDAYVERLRSQFGELTEVGRPVAEGDFVTVNMTIRSGVETLREADDELYEVGSGTIVPEVDEHLRGTRPGEILRFSAPHPQGETPLDFTILVKEVKERVLPALDDEWANEASEFETLAELRADIATRLGRVKRGTAKLALREKVSDALAELIDEEVPEPLVEAEMQHRLQDLAMRLSAQGADLEQYLAATGNSPDQLREELRSVALRAVKVDLGLRAVADAEGLDVTDEELDDAIALMAGRLREKPETVRRRLERGEQLPAVRSDIRNGKALDWLVERVEIVDEAGQPIDRRDLEDPEPTDEVDDTGGASTDETGRPAG
jgi:trigger factor